MHTIIDPAILDFGTPVVLVSSSNEDGSPNLAPASSPAAPVAPAEVSSETAR